MEDNNNNTNNDEKEIIYYIDDKYEAVCRYLENLPLEKSIKSIKSRRVSDPYDSQCNFIFTNLAKIDFLRIDNGVLVNNLKGSQHLSNKAYLAYHVKASDYDYLMPLQWSAAYDDISTLIGMLIVTTLYTYCYQIIKGNTQHCLLKNDKEFRETVQILLMDTVFQQSSEYGLLTQLLSTFHNFQQSIDAYDHESLTRVLNNIDSQQKWRKSWGGQQEIWIVKPVGLSCGENIHVFKGFRDVLIHAKTMKYKCIVQKYIERPLLVRQNRKFDIRQWVLVSNVDPLVIYGFSECYLRLSSKSYTLECNELMDATIHLTNHAIQKKSIPAIDTDDSSLVCDTMMTQQQFDDTLRELFSNNNKPTIFRDHDNNDNNNSNNNNDDNSDNNDNSIFNKIIKPQIKKIAIETISSVRDMLRKVGDGYQWLGLDLMVTEDDMQVLLIEVNVSPDISFSTPITARLVSAGVADLMRLVIHEGKVKNGNKESIEFSNVDHDCRSLLKWELWHRGNREGYQKISAFTKKKNEYAILGKNYIPRNEDLANRILKIMNPNEFEEDYEIQEDEI